MDGGNDTSDRDLAMYIRNMRNSGRYGVSANYGCLVWIGVSALLGPFFEWLVSDNTGQLADIWHSPYMRQTTATAVTMFCVFVIGMALARYALPRLIRHAKQYLDRGGFLALALAKYALRDTPELLKRYRMLGITTRIKLANPDEIRNRLWALELSHPGLLRKAGQPLLPSPLVKLRIWCVVFPLAWIAFQLLIVASILLWPMNIHFGGTGLDYSLLSFWRSIFGRPDTIHYYVFTTVILTLFMSSVFTLLQLSALRLAAFRLVLADTLDEWFADGRLEQVWLAETDNVAQP